MIPQRHIEGFEKYWRRRKPGTSTAVHYTSDVRIFFKWANNLSPEIITVHDVDRFIEWQQSIGRAPATIRRRLIALRMFYDYLTYACDQEIPNPVVPRRHYVSRGRGHLGAGCAYFANMEGELSIMRVRYLLVLPSCYTTDNRHQRGNKLLLPWQIHPECAWLFVQVYLVIEDCRHGYSKQNEFISQYIW
jgi:hypothetical protein